MANMVKTVGTYGTRKTILIGQESYYLAVPVKITGSANATVKAGEPLAGDLTDRGTAFTVSTSSSVGVNLHDVVLDADGKGNATCVVVGCIDVKKIDSTVATHIGSASLSHIILVEGSAI